MRSPDSPQTDPLLQMSVHSLPTPAGDADQRTRMGRIKMLLVLAVCAAPVVASYFTFYVVRPQGRTNHGTLITPTQPMPADAQLVLRDMAGQVVKASALKGQWLLVTVADAACDAVCEKHLYLQRQLRETLGKDKDRLDRVWLVSDAAPVRAEIQPGLKDAWVLRAAPTELARWLTPDAGQPLSAHLYLVDPRGDWMMRFPAQADPTGIKKDLTRLLKASESWDKAGR